MNSHNIIGLVVTGNKSGCNWKLTRIVKMEKVQDQDFKLMKDTEKEGFIRSAVSTCCRGRSKYHKNYTWRYA